LVTRSAAISEKFLTSPQPRLYLHGPRRTPKKTTMKLSSLVSWIAFACLTTLGTGCAATMKKYGIK
jgi:hypothetical protein